METDNNKIRLSLGEILVKTGVITAERMQKVLQDAKDNNKTIEQILIGDKLVTPKGLVRAISVHLGVPLISLAQHKVNPEVIKLIPEELARKYNILPLDIIGKSLVIVMGDVANIQAIDEIAAMVKMRQNDELFPCFLNRSYNGTRGRFEQSVSLVK